MQSNGCIEIPPIRPFIYRKRIQGRLKEIYSTSRQGLQHVPYTTRSDAFLVTVHELDDDPSAGDSFQYEHVPAFRKIDDHVLAPDKGLERRKHERPECINRVDIFMSKDSNTVDVKLDDPLDAPISTELDIAAFDRYEFSRMSNHESSHSCGLSVVVHHASPIGRRHASADRTGQ